MCIIIAIYTQEAATFNILGRSAATGRHLSNSFLRGCYKSDAKKTLPSVQSINERFVGEPRIFTPVSTTLTEELLEFRGTGSHCRDTNAQRRN